MKKSELKKVLKPLIKECIKEVIFEDGVLSGIVSEVVKGVSSPIVEARSNFNMSSMKQPKPKDRSKELQETRKRMLDVVGKDAYNGINLFEGTQALPEKANSHSPLSNMAPADPGVDISGLFNSNWSKLI